ncbi:MAG: hypothetical protein H8D23_16600 [Candidatus Brocadiales bacterium]|nr:hypothetical protein [Candidatus Brocadiales bacterium]
METVSHIEQIKPIVTPAEFAEEQRTKKIKTFNILKGNPSKEERMLYMAFRKTIVFGKMFLAGDFMKSETPFFHYEICDELDSDSEKPLAVILPRESAKTTLVKGSILHDFFFAKLAYEWGWRDYDEKLFYVWVAKSQKDSFTNVEYIAMHLDGNAKFKRYAPNWKGKTWNKEELVLYNGCRLSSFSTLRSARGQTLPDIEQGAQRISRAFIDDAENEENTKTAKSRDSLKDSLLNGLLPGIEKNYPRRRMIFTGTPVHFDAMAQNLLDDWETVVKEGTQDTYPWKVITYKSTQPTMPGGVLWHSHRPRHVLDGIKAVYEKGPRGVGGYNQEYELEVQSSEDAKWSKEHIRFHDGQYMYIEGQGYLHINGDMLPVNVFVGCDPATDIDNNTSDYSVIMAVAVDAQGNKYVLEYERHRSIPTAGRREPKIVDGEIVDWELIGKSGVIDYLIDFAKRYNITGGRIEDVAMNRSVFSALNDLKQKLNAHYAIYAPHAPGGTNKHNRIYSFLSTDFSNGKVFYRKNHYELIDETWKFGPFMAHDDTIEGFYYACVGSYPPRPKRATKEGVGNTTNRHLVRVQRLNNHINKPKRKRSWRTM